MTPAEAAIIDRNKERLASEIKTSGDPDQCGKDGRSLLMLAVIEGYSELVELLLTSGASVNLQGKRDRYSALHFAAQDQRPDIVKLLIEAGANIEARDKFGNTPLGKATFHSKGTGETIKALLACGADPNNQNDYSNSPLSLARMIANYKIEQFFE